MNLTDGASLATILGVVIALLALVVPGIVALIRENSVRVTAVNAETRSEEAAKAARDSANEAKRAADALHGLHAIEERKLALELEQRDLEEAQAEGERIPLGWINRALRDGEQVDRITRDVSYTHSYTHERIENFAELCAARRALKHGSIRTASTVTPRIGESFGIEVFNPKHAAN